MLTWPDHLTRHATGRGEMLDGWVRYQLLPHGAGHEGWELDGTPSPPGLQCGALTGKGVRCPKEGVVSMAYLNDGEVSIWRLDLCGGHFGMHRRGKPVPLA